MMPGNLCAARKCCASNCDRFKSLSELEQKKRIDKVNDVPFYFTVRVVFNQKEDKVRASSSAAMHRGAARGS